MDLRAEVRELEPSAREAWLARLADDWRTAELGPADRALCAYAEKLTRTPGSMTAADLEPLRRAGLDDPALHEAVQVIAYFNYINRVADALHVDLEPGMPAHPASPGNEAAPPSAG